MAAIGPEQAQSAMQVADAAGAAVPAISSAGAPDPRDRALYLDFIRALARQAARADHADEISATPDAR